MPCPVWPQISQPGRLTLLSISLDRVCVVGVYMDVMHRRVDRGIGVDASLENLLPTRPRLLADALHDNFTTGTQRPRGLRVIELIIGARRVVIRDPQQLATSVQVRGPLRGCEKMGLAPSRNGENPGKSAVAKVPVPIFSHATV